MRLCNVEINRDDGTALYRRALLDELELLSFAVGSRDGVIMMAVDGYSDVPTIIPDGGSITITATMSPEPKPVPDTNWPRLPV